LDAGSFADAVERLAKDEDLRQSMAAQAVERVRELFTVKRAVDETLRIYDSLRGKTPH
jgi:glycosyltransferase involved in cell wall biosynthesis